MISGLVIGAALEIMASGELWAWRRFAFALVTGRFACTGFGGRSEMMYTGCVLSLASAFVYAVSFVVSEAAMCDPNAPDPKYVASRMGIAASCLCALYVVSVILLWLDLP